MNYEECKVKGCHTCKENPGQVFWAGTWQACRDCKGTGKDLGKPFEPGIQYLGLAVYEEEI